MVDNPVDSNCDDATEKSNEGPSPCPDPERLPSRIYALGIVLDRHGQTELDEEADKAKAKYDEFHNRRPDSSYGVYMECRPNLNSLGIDVTPY